MSGSNQQLLPQVGYLLGTVPKQHHHTLDQVRGIGCNLFLWGAGGSCESSSGGRGVMYTHIHIHTHTHTTKLQENWNSCFQKIRVMLGVDDVLHEGGGSREGRHTNQTPLHL